MARKAIVSAAIVRLMESGQRHAWTLEDLHAGLAHLRLGTDFSSVFRAAEKLASSGILRKLLLDDGCARFELVGAHHDHLHCTRCHEIVPVPCVIDRGVFLALERDAGVTILDHHLILNGICRNCRSAGGSGM
jgi:Fur family ferric uptake transcriptional regulator